MAGILGSDDEDFLDHTEPLDVFQQDFSRRIADVKELGTSVYRECWEEFYRWEPGECQQLIADLPPNSSDSADFEELTDLLSSNSVSKEQNLEMDVDSSMSEKTITVTIYDRDGSSSQAQITFEEVTVTAFVPHPTYESCPPTSKNIARQLDEENEHIRAPFVPYADEQEFDAIKYASGCESFAWQVDWRDPDLDVIQLETARRLHFGREISFAEIDSMSFLKQLRMSNESGLLWDMSQRDVLIWPGAYNPHLPTFTSTMEDDQNGEAHVRLKNDLQARLSALLQTFCPNLNCVQAACPMHTGANIYPEIPNMYRHTHYDPVKPRVTNKEMRDSEGTPCGEECFRDIGEDFAEQVYWGDPVDLATLKTILDISPDLYPCELSVLCRKPCREIYVQRMSLYKDDDISDVQSQENSKKSRVSRRLKPKNMKDEAQMSFTPFPPCHHKGPCAAKSGCSCFQQKHHCQRNCRCGSECALRWKGCKCQKKNKPCGKNCKCVRANRECDVDLCTPCGARHGSRDGSRDGCQNVKIQQGISKGVEIKRGAFGLGAFATTAISPNDYLGEYVGELFTTDNTPNETAAKYRGLNYNFSANETWVIDAARVGNNTRYANHGTSSKTNCEARIPLVNGEHRIGFFATKKIPVGDEILLDYGEGYWQGQTPGC